MAYNKTEEIVYNIALSIVEENDLDIWDVEFKKEGSEYYLRIFLDKNGGVSIDDCEAVSRALSDILDEKDPISCAYMLEVCSAGIDRQLKRDSDFEKFLGSDVDVKLYAPLDGKKEFTAKLKAYDGGVITFDVDGKETKVSKNKTSSVRLTVKF